MACCGRSCRERVRNAVSAEAPSLASEDPLQLTFCPRCDYSLQGLPREGVCPECGRAYDQSFVIIRGYPASEHNDAAWMSGRFSVWSVVTFLAAAGIFCWYVRHEPPMTYFWILFIFGYSVFAMFVGVLTRVA